MFNLLKKLFGKKETKVAAPVVTTKVEVKKAPAKKVTVKKPVAKKAPAKKPAAKKVVKKSAKKSK